jgi:hypothetical protein
MANRPVTVRRQLFGCAQVHYSCRFRASVPLPMHPASLSQLPSMLLSLIRTPLNVTLTGPSVNVRETAPPEIIPVTLAFKKQEKPVQVAVPDTFPLGLLSSSVFIKPSLAKPWFWLPGPSSLFSQVPTQSPLIDVVKLPPPELLLPPQPYTSMDIEVTTTKLFNPVIIMSAPFMFHHFNQQCSVGLNTDHRP